MQIVSNAKRVPVKTVTNHFSRLQGPPSITSEYVRVLFLGERYDVHTDNLGANRVRDH